MRLSARHIAALVLTQKSEWIHLQQSFAIQCRAASLKVSLLNEGQTIRLTGARDVAEFALGSEPAQNAFIEQLFHQVAKQPMLAYGADVPDRLRQSFAASQFNMQKLLVDIATLSALHGSEKTVRTK